MLPNRPLRRGTSIEVVLGCAKLLLLPSQWKNQVTTISANQNTPKRFLFFTSLIFSFAPPAAVHVRQCELQFLLYCIGAIQPHANSIADGIRLPRALADDLPGVLVIDETFGPSVSIGTSPSTNSSVSSTKKPYLVVLMISASNSSPTRSSMNFTFFHSIELAFGLRGAPFRERGVVAHSFKAAFF